MDEPSATLTPQEVERLFAIIADLKRHGLGIIYISHRLDEIYAIADRVLVLRDGAAVGVWPVAAISRDQLIEKMVGRKLEQEFPKRRVELGPPKLVVRDLHRGQQSARRIVYDSAWGSAGPDRLGRLRAHGNRASAIRRRSTRRRQHRTGRQAAESARAARRHSAPASRCSRKTAKGRG